MEIHTTNKDMRKFLQKSLKDIKKEDKEDWSEYELRLLIQDEISCMQEQIKKKLE